MSLIFLSHGKPSCKVHVEENGGKNGELSDYTVVSLFIREQVHEGDFCIDATCGNGHDTLLLCELVGDSGLVAGFDIQKEAVEKTETRLAETGMNGRGRIFCCGHEK